MFHPLSHFSISRHAENWQGTGVSGKCQWCSKIEILKHPSVKFVVVFVLSNLQSVYWCMPEAMKWKTLKNAILPPVNTSLQLTTVRSGCWLPNRCSCHDSRDTWDSALGLYILLPSSPPDSLRENYKGGGLQWQLWFDDRLPRQCTAKT